MTQIVVKRRRLLQGTQVLLATSMVPGLALGVEVADFFAPGTTIREGKVVLKTPALAENGNSVPLSVSVDSPMTPENYVKEIVIYAPKNPVPLIARFELSPASGEAAVSTRMRFSDSQMVTAVATMSDGTMWQGSAKTIITLAACVEPLL